MCRICCSYPATINLFECENELVRQQLISCARVSVSEGDGLPPSVCPGCKMELARCHRFVLQAETSDRNLRAALEQTLQVKKEEGYELDDFYHDDYEDQKTDCNTSDYLLTPLEDTKPIEIKQENGELKERPKRTYKKRKRKNAELVCSVCSRACSTAAALQSHMRNHTDERPYACQHCSRRFKNKGSINRHMQRTHVKHEQQKYICEVCGKYFAQKHNMDRHVKIHSGETPYSCSLCPAKFTQSGSLARHEARHSGVKPFSCSACGKSFSTKDQLRSHHLVHTTEKKHSCHICNNLFKSTNSLAKHMNLHNPESSFVCNYCGRLFRAKGNLKLHIEKQHSERSGQCNICSKTVPNIDIHMRKHTGERPLKCELCPSTFFEQNGLAHHINFRHKNQGKYKCQYDGCVETFPSQPMLLYHQAKFHTSVLPYPCGRCARAFYRKNDLARHMIGTHKEKLM